MSVPSAIPTAVSRKRFCELIDPLLAALGLTANQVKSASFDWNGFELVVFEQDENGHKIVVHSGCAMQTVRVFIERDVA